MAIVMSTAFLATVSRTVLAPNTEFMFMRCAGFRNDGRPCHDVLGRFIFSQGTNIEIKCKSCNTLNVIGCPT